MHMFHAPLVQEGNFFGHSPLFSLEALGGTNLLSVWLLWSSCFTIRTRQLCNFVNPLNTKPVFVLTQRMSIITIALTYTWKKKY